MKTKEDRHIQWARRDSDRQRVLLLTPRVGDRPSVIASPKLQDDSMGCVVWNPTGEGRLRLAYPVPSRTHPPMRRGALEFQDAYLVLDDLPLLHWRQNLCPSCEQLARASAAQPSDIARVMHGLQDLTLDTLAGHPSASVPWLMWLFALLPAGFYLVTLRNYSPIADPFSVLTRFGDVFENDALFCLVPTQRLDILRPESVDRAEVTYRTHPGIALYLHDRASALLDGHHRALAAARKSDVFSCITVIPGRVHLPTPERGTACNARNHVVPQLSFGPTLGPADALLSLDDVPKELHEWTRVQATCTSRRWEWDNQTVDQWEASFSR